jgi:hypothetical protein
MSALGCLLHFLCWRFCDADDEGAIKSYMFVSCFAYGCSGIYRLPHPSNCTVALSATMSTGKETKSAVKDNKKPGKTCSKSTDLPPVELEGDDHNFIVDANTEGDNNCNAYILLASQATLAAETLLASGDRQAGIGQAAQRLADLCHSQGEALRHQAQVFASIGATLLSAQHRRSEGTLTGNKRKRAASTSSTRGKNKKSKKNENGRGASSSTSSNDET